MTFLQAAIKAGLSGIIVYFASEAGQKSALIASIPIVSVLVMIWMHQDGKTMEHLMTFSKDLVWMVLASLVLFISFPILASNGLSFWPALGVGCALTMLAYGGVVMAMAD